MCNQGRGQSITITNRQRQWWIVNYSLKSLHTSEYYCTVSYVITDYTALRLTALDWAVLLLDLPSAKLCPGEMLGVYLSVSPDIDPRVTWLSWSVINSDGSLAAENGATEAVFLHFRRDFSRKLIKKSSVSNKNEFVIVSRICRLIWKRDDFFLSKSLL